MKRAKPHGFQDNSISQLTDDDINKINLQAAEDFAKRSIPGSIVIFLALLLSITYIESLAEFPLITNSFLALLLVSILSRYFILKRLPKQSVDNILGWKLLFSAAVLTTGLVWGAFLASNILLHAESKFTLFIMMFTVGVAGGAAISLFIWKNLAHLYLLALLLPSTVLVIIDWGPLSIIVIFAFTSYFIFLYVQIERSNREYWIALYQTKLLEMHTQELEKHAEKEIRYLAHHDTLTGLVNRHSLNELLGQVIHQASRQGTKVAILAIDLDYFKRINDSSGHHVGDAVLKAVSERLKIAAKRDSDIIARPGGDEFIIVLTEVADSTTPALISTTVIHLLSQAFNIDNFNHYLSGSIGISMFPEDGKTKEELLRNADLAMYHAKESGRHQFQFFNEQMNSLAKEIADIGNYLRSAMTENQLELYYQPKIQASNQKLIGFEALLRWKHPEKGFIPPDKFIPVAESTGQITNIGSWVIETACKQLHEWGHLGNEIHVAINVSIHQLRLPGFTREIGNILEKYNLSVDQIQLEITESVAMDDPENTLHQLNSIHEMGIKIAVDDFGTGYSSMAYLKMLPLHYLKLDREFVKDIESDSNDRAICDATISLSHALGLQVIAEGVETEIQNQYLIEKGCDYLQGYFYGKPLPSEEATQFMLTHR